jgi:uncharacterized protein (TIGR00725 family)
MTKKLPVVGVFGASEKSLKAISASAAIRSTAALIGELIAGSKAHLLTGAGQGVMQAAAEGFCRVDGRQGFSIGIVPYNTKTDQPKPNYPNPFVEIPIFTHLSSEARNLINATTVHLAIVLPGGKGTDQEREAAENERKPIFDVTEDDCCQIASRSNGCGNDRLAECTKWLNEKLSQIRTTLEQL